MNALAGVTVGFESTLMHILAGLDRPTSGNVTLDGEDITDLGDAELGMLRAVGMSRRQVRTMVRYEAVITALIGAILGTVLGVIFAVLVSRPLADEGFELSYPVGTLIVLLVLAALAGVVAAIGPARRASRLDVLRALAYE